MEELGYRPNSVARALVTGRSKTLGVVSFDTTLYGPASTLFGIERAAHEAGYFIIVASLKALNRSSVIDAVERLRRQGVDGILVIAPYREAGRRAPARADRHTARGRRGGSRPRLARWSRSTRSAGAVSATRHLLDLGHRVRLAHHRTAELHRVAPALEGWRQRSQAAGAEAPEPAGRRLEPARRLRTRAAPERRSGRHRGVCGQRPDGARGAAGDARGRPRGPGGLSVVGFDDIPEAAYFLPPLTTVRQDFIEMGRRSLQTLLRTIETGERSGSGLLVPPELIVRASTGPARRGDEKRL